jgi:four helix bundle protein
MRDHRSLKAWQEARRLAKFGIRLARDHWRPYASGAFSQLQRASLSVQLNIAEGYARKSPAQIRQGLTIAYGSAVEAGEILELLMEEGAISPETGREALAAACLCQRLLLGLLRHYRQPATSTDP